MAQNKNALLYIKAVLDKYTDENHGLRTEDLIRRLYEEEGIKVGRKSIYDSVQALIAAGCDIDITKGRGSQYKMLSKGYELPEIKAIIDSIAAATFLSEKKAAQLIEKVKTLTSVYNAQQLTEGLTLTSTVRTDNEKVYYALDSINTAIAENKQISFKYFDYECASQLRRIMRNGGKAYEVSPFRLVVKNDKYYLIGDSKKRQELTTFRVDRMDEVKITDVRRNLKKANGVDFDAYIKSSFDMYTDEAQPIDVKVEFKKELLRVVVDRFGKDVTMTAKKDTIIVETTVRSKRTFYSWLLNFGGDAKLLAPQSLVDDFKAELQRVLQNY